MAILRSCLRGLGLASTRFRTAAGSARGPINHPLGLTIYCSDHGRPAGRPSEQRIVRPNVTRRRSRLLTSAALPSALCSPCRRAAPTTSGDRHHRLDRRLGAARRSANGAAKPETWGERYAQEPADAEAALRYAAGAARDRPARAGRCRARAGRDRTIRRIPCVLGAYGRALADVGRSTRRSTCSSRAHTPDQPDWRILSAQGAVLDQMGRHEEAQRYYASALKIVPDEPSVLSNLGLSYALSKNLPKAEETLRRASAQPGAEPRVRQNLALVVGLQGRFAEAEDDRARRSVRRTRRRRMSPICGRCSPAERLEDAEQRARAAKPARGSSRPPLES